MPHKCQQIENYDVGLKDVPRCYTNAVNNNSNPGGIHCEYILNQQEYAGKRRAFKQWKFTKINIFIE